MLSEFRNAGQLIPRRSSRARRRNRIKACLVRRPIEHEWNAQSIETAGLF
jgi:hypothetical protein